MLHMELGHNPDASVRLLNSDLIRYETSSAVRWQLDVPRVKKRIPRRENMAMRPFVAHAATIEDKRAPVPVGAELAREAINRIPKITHAAKQRAKVLEHSLHRVALPGFHWGARMTRREVASVLGCNHLSVLPFRGTSSYSIAILAGSIIALLRRRPIFVICASSNYGRSMPGRDIAKALRIASATSFTPMRADWELIPKSCMERS
jgi:hypothetical protein